MGCIMESNPGIAENSALQEYCLVRSVRKNNEALVNATKASLFTAALKESLTQDKPKTPGFQNSNIQHCLPQAVFS